MDLLTLAACNTGMGGTENGDELFAYLLQELGARSLLMSKWSVNDRSTGPLMERFYRLWGKADPQKPYAYPYFGAPFILIGN